MGGRRDGFYLPVWGGIVDGLGCKSFITPLSRELPADNRHVNVEQIGTFGNSTYRDQTPQLVSKRVVLVPWY